MPDTSRVYNVAVISSTYHIHPLLCNNSPLNPLIVIVFLGKWWQQRNILFISYTIGTDEDVACTFGSPIRTFVILNSVAGSDASVKRWLNSEKQAWTMYNRLLRILGRNLHPPIHIPVPKKRYIHPLLWNVWWYDRCPNFLFDSFSC